MRRAFRGGIRFSDPLRTAKKTALESPLTVFLPDVIRFPLTERDVVFTPRVAYGDIVRVGDVLAVDGSGAQPPIPSGLSGVVSFQDDSRLTLDGSVCRLLTVTGDGKQTPGALLPPLPSEADADTIVRRMYDAGLVGLGGAGFPTFQKYRGHTAQHLLINVCECEPYLASDGRLAIEQGDSVREGVTYLMRAGGVPAHGVRLCAESTTVARALQRIAENTTWRVELLPERYPQGSEKQLIRAVLKQEVPQGVYPAQRGILVSNLATAVAMADAARGLPLTHRAVTVSGIVEQPCNLLVPIGTPLRVLAAQARPLITGRRAQLIAGGAMTGRRVASPDAGLSKACGGVLVLPTESEEETPCIRCGACVRACPSGLMPYLIDASWLQHEDALCAELKPTACISCGCCSRVCPARRQLAARITQLRRKGV